MNILEDWKHIVQTVFIMLQCLVCHKTKDISVSFLYMMYIYFYIEHGMLHLFYMLQCTIFLITYMSQIIFCNPLK